VEKNLKTDCKEAIKKPNPFYSILINIVIPSIILIKLSNSNYLGPIFSLIIALAFPIIYGLHGFFKRNDLNFFSILGFISISLTGLIGLMQLSGNYIILKETAIPLIIGIAIIVFQKTKYPLVNNFFNELLNIQKIQKAFREKDKSFEKNLDISSYLLAAVFFISALLNFIIAKIIIKSSPATPAFNQELGKMLALSFPIIALPAIIMIFLIIIFLIIQIKKSTNLDFDSIFR